MGPWGCPGGMTGLAGSSVPLDGLWWSGGRFPFREAASMFWGWLDEARSGPVGLGPFMQRFLKGKPFGASYSECFGYYSRPD
jgi:hypothetical protein